MKISTRFSLRKSFSLLVIMFIYLFTQNGFGQTIPATDGNPGNCSNCAPPGWFDAGGTPDISNSTTAADAGTGGGGTDWVVSPGSTTNINLPLPPNGHTDWLSLRDLGSAGTEESVSTTIGGLTVGEEYEVVAYSLTAVTEANGSGLRYAGVYNDQYTFEAGGSVRVVQLSGAPNVWRTDKLRFLAGATSETLIIRPGANGAATGTTTADFSLFETVQVSITVDAVNEVPVADSNTTTTLVNNPTTFNVTSTDVDNDGNIDDATVDLDPSTPGIQNSLVTADGTWSVDSSGNVTFSPINGFVGTATIPYTVNDDYTLDGVNASATSNPANLSVTVLPDSDGDGVEDSADLDNDNDGILDVNECSSNTTVLSITGDDVATSTGGYPITATVTGLDGASDETLSTFNILATTNGNDIYKSCELSFSTGNFDDGIQLLINGTRVLEFNQYHWDVSAGALTTEFNGGGRFDIDNNGSWSPWTNEGNPVLQIKDGVIQLMVDTNLGTREDALPFMDPTNFPGDFEINTSVSIDCSVGVNVAFGNSNHGGPGSITNPQMTVDVFSCIDTDSDGIPNSEDTDSDNDGCPDAIEGAGNFTSTNLTSSNNLADNDEGAVNGSGVPTNSGSPQATTTGVTTATHHVVDHLRHRINSLKTSA